MRATNKKVLAFRVQGLLKCLSRIGFGDTLHSPSLGLRV